MNNTLYLPSDAYDEHSEQVYIQGEWRWPGNKLREKFFNECVDEAIGFPAYANIPARVNMAPHDLFEWFKEKLAATHPDKDNGI